MVILLLAVGFGIGLVASRTSTFSDLSDKAYSKYKEMKDKVCKKID